MNKLASALLGVIKRNIDEIASDRALVVAGALVAFTHVLTFVVWRTAQPLEEVIASTVAPICWPMFDECGSVRSRFDVDTVLTIAFAYGALSVACVALFAWCLRNPSRTALAWGALVVVNLVKLAIVALDFRLRLNQHYMAGIASLVFLVWPNKRDAVRIVIALFYAWSGALKLNREWLSGSALYDVDKLWVPSSLVPAACVYVVFLEIALVWGLFARRRLVFAVVIAQLALFHVMSWPIVSFFYPMIMFTLLGVVVCCRQSAREERPRLATSNALLVVIFSLLQLVPAFIPGDSAVTGEGRLFSLHMFDARIECRPHYLVDDGRGRVYELPVPADFSWRIFCDPIVIRNVARNYCVEHGDPKLRVLLRSRHSNETKLRTVVDVDDFCRVQPRYRAWWRNEWIRTQ